MEDCNREQLLKRIEMLEREVSSLKERISSLEGMGGQNVSPVSSAAVSKATPNKKDRFPGKHPRLDSAHWRDGLESLVGGKLLNRVAILVLLFGMAYFLKYSFDNNWIGITGRIIIGLLGGIAFLTTGDIAMGRGYRYFSQGLSGGGIAVIYLTTFAATNFYHVFSPALAFGLLALAALAGGMLSVRQNAFGVAVLSTLGGFLTPFLIGGKSSSPLLLLTYITILDLVVLYLAKYRNWRSLNLLSFAGTALVYLVFKSSQPFDGEVFIYQSFLLVYFVIFGSLTFYYNIRHNQPTRSPDVSLMVLNIGFFLGASLENLHEYPDWHGLLALSLAGLYLVISTLLQRKKTGDSLLIYSLLGIGLALVTVAIPIQLEGDWRDTAWVVEGIVLVYAGIKAGNTSVHRAGMFVLAMAALFQATAYTSPYPDYAPLFNTRSLSAFLAIAGFYIVFYLFHTRPGLAGRRFVLWPAAVIGTLLTLRQVSLEVMHAIQYYKLAYQVDFAVSLAWVIIAVIIITIGMARDIKGFRLIALGLFGVTLSKILLYDLSNLDMVFRVLLLFIVGAILLGISFIYQRKDRKEEQ